MPNYTYRCKKCLNYYNRDQSIYDQPFLFCKDIQHSTNCSGEVYRVISKNIGLKFSGSGFYINDQKQASSNKENTKQETKKSPSKPKSPSTETTSPTKKASKTPSKDST